MKTLDDVISHFGSITAFADALEVTTQAISQWKEDKLIPEMRAFQIEVLTNGEFKAVELPQRPRRRSHATRATA